MNDAVPLRTWMAVVGGTLAAFVPSLNGYFVGASLGLIQGGLGATIDDVAVISTAHLVAQLITVPLTGWLQRTFSVRRFLLASATMYIIFSMACALAQDAEQMIAFRVLQGLAAGLLMPTPVFLIITLLPASRRPLGLAILAMVTTVGPAFGPTLGGWLAQEWGWQSIFLVTIAPGAVALVVLSASLERQPAQLELLRRGDWLGIITMALGLGSLDTLLQEGNRLEWFESRLISGLAVVSAVSLTLFVWFELRTAQPFLNLRLLARRNFLAGAVSMLLLGLALYGSDLIQPLYLARVHGLSPAQIGEVRAWTALPQFLIIPLLPFLIGRVDARWLVALGFSLLATSNLMLTDMSRDVAADQMILPNIVFAVGLALLMTPLSALAVAGIAPADAPSAAPLLSVTRYLGGAIGVAALKSFLEQRLHLHASRIGESVSLFDEDTRQRLEQMTQQFLQHGMVDPAHASHKALAIIAGRVREQAGVMAVGDGYTVIAIAMLMGLCTLLLYLRTASTAKASARR